ncbi:GtrA family protein [Ottowia thiooxydans]|uniref:GtrA family protein n=1 Tax=Ottowia thiooxydans TaxID=219182 RepID=UPI00048DA0B6|nr:GtrA family protein [Ottowia thiooxydans]
MINLSQIDIRQILRFLMVGGLNTAFSYFVYSLALYVGLNFIWANLCAVVCGILVSFRTQGKIVFKKTGSYAFIRYIGFWFVIWILNISLIWVIKQYINDPYVAGALALGPIVIASYFIQKYWVFA